MRPGSIWKKTGMRNSFSAVRNCSWMSVTEPTRTLELDRGADVQFSPSPRSRPRRPLLGQKLGAPQQHTPMTTKATAPTTNAPISFGFARFTALLLSLMDSGLDRSIRPSAAPSPRVRNVRTFGSGQASRRPWDPAGDHGFGVGIEKDRVVPNGEDARQLVRHHHHRGAETIAQLEDQLIQSRELIGSSPAEGSSKNRISGSSAMARANPARFCMPPLICEG